VYLITGGCGFIGSHIAEALLSQGSRVRILDNLSTGRRENIASFNRSVELIIGDIRDEDCVERAMEGVRGVFHQAALVSVTQSVQNPQLNHDINIQGTFNILEKARRAKVKRIVMASSAAVYGNDSELPKKEESLLSPVSPYGTAKMIGELYGSLYMSLYGVESVALRYFNVYGERQDPSSPYSGVLSLFKKAFQDKEPRITIFGDGEQTRDFIYVKDVARANLMAMDSPVMAGEAFNVGTGERVSLLHVLMAFEKITGKRCRKDFKKGRPGDIRHSQADIEKLKTRGFQLAYSLEEGLINYLAEKEFYG